MAGLVTRHELSRLLQALESGLDQPARLFVAGEASLVLEGWREWTDRVVYAAADTNPPGFEPALERAAAQTGVTVEHEPPADVIPLPEGFEARARVANGWREARTETAGPGSAAAHAAASQPLLRVLHYDPYSVAFRLIARGDEPDYHVVLAFLEHGWLVPEEMDRLLAELLARFSTRTLAQDPAEFRRKYKGLLQMWRARAVASR